MNMIVILYRLNLKVKKWRMSVPVCVIERKQNTKCHFRKIALLICLPIRCEAYMDRVFLEISTRLRYKTEDRVLIKNFVR